ncbi:MAG: hypothetical protein QME47_01995, partial [Candidatus Thermoplasmatota archaeon]|nr:hypothetical protein [Candidatus Thermoplasmatota archaeon]
MKIKKLSAVIAFVLILLSSLSFIPLNAKGAVVESDSEVPIALYFHRNNTMNTTPPAVGVEAKASLKDGGSITFFSPELKEDLTVNTIYCNVSFYLEIKVTQVHTPHTDPNETVDVKLSFSFENPELRAEATEWFEDVIEWSGWKTVNLTYDKTGKVTLKKYSNLTLKISSKAVPSSILAYNYNVTLYYDEKNYASQVSFPCSPVTATVTTEGGTEFKPYAPTPEIPFKGNIKDAFDNEDLKEVRLEINGPGYHYTTPPLENITPGDYT